MNYIVLLSTVAYLLGSVNTAIVISKTLFKTDIRDRGSGNAGATNMLRVFGKRAGAVVFLLDFLKGLIAVSVARIVVLLSDAPYECIFFAGFFAQLGHTFPLFFRFKGGKGVATAAGAAFGVMPAVTAVLLGFFALVVILTKTVSVASGICAAVYPILAYFFANGNAVHNFIFAASCAVMIAVKHVPNIIRLLDGKENKISTDT